MFGEDWKDPNAPAGEKVVAHSEEAQELIEEQQHLAELQKFCKWFVPIISIIAAAVALGLVVYTSGSQPSYGVPRAAVIVVEGFKGTTFDALMAMNKLPNLQYLAAGGTMSRCSSLSDSRCCRTQSGQMADPTFLWKSGPGIASILTGVDVTKHQVSNDSFQAYSNFATTSRAYPSFLAIAKNNSLSTEVIGSGHFITSTSGRGSACDLLGVADFECGTDAVGRCLQTSTCNVDARVTTLPSNDFAGTEEINLDSSIDSAFANLNADIIVVHTNKLARLAEDSNYPNFYYSENSAEYAAEAYLIDTIIGQLAAQIKARVIDIKENWLIIVTSDHGGLGKNSGTNNDDDQVVPFVLSTMTSNGNLVLNPLTLPTTQMDVAPTLLSWFGVQGSFDGVVQGICGNGRNPTDCTLTQQ